MKNQEGEEEGGGCCGKGKCCGGKALAALALLLLGGIGGYFAGRCGTTMCLISPASVLTPAQTK